MPPEVTRFSYPAFSIVLPTTTVCGLSMPEEQGNRARSAAHAEWSPGMAQGGHLAAHGKSRRIRRGIGNLR